jgi:tRNA 2-thiocytidine biosynthesis protein TtcA
LKATLKLRKQTGKAICDWSMIRNGDSILVGISGGKDSLCLYYILHELKRVAPVSFQLIPCFINGGFEGADAVVSAFETYFKQKLFVCDVNISGALKERKPNQCPCVLCARLRRAVLVNYAEEHSCRCVALGHHLDDVMESYLLNLFYSGKKFTMKPSYTLYDGRVNIIRPFISCRESLIEEVGQLLELPTHKICCPLEETRSQRARIKSVVNLLAGDDIQAYRNFYNAMKFDFGSPEDLES